MTTKIDIVNAALVETGNGARQVENDGSCENLISNLNWDLLVEAELEAFHYAFARKSVQLQAAVEPDFGFPKAWRLPEDCHIVRRIFEPFEDCCKPKCIELDHSDWEEADGIIYVDDCKLRWRQKCDDLGPWIEYTQRLTDPDKWGSNFKLGIKFRLAAIFARSINEEDGQSAGLNAEADRYFQIARDRSGRRYNGHKMHRKPGRLLQARMGVRHGPR